MEQKQRKRICLLGLTLVIVGSTSFSNYPTIGGIVTLAGAVLIIIKEVLWRRNKAM